MRHLALLALAGSLAACTADTGEDDDTGEEVPAIRSVDLTGATGFAFIQVELEERSTIHGAGGAELHKVLADGSVEPLFPEGWSAEEYGMGPTRFLVRLEELHWFDAIDEGAPYPGLWCRFVSFATDAPGEQPLTCHLPLEVLDDCADPEGDPSELGVCWVYPNAYDIGPDDTVWALWQADGYNIYAWTDDLAIRVTPAGVLEADLSGNNLTFAALEGGVAVNAGTIEIGLETYWLDGEGGGDLAFVPNERMVRQPQTIRFGGHVLVEGYDGLALLDDATRASISFDSVATFDGATPVEPVFDFMDGPTLYIRTGTTAAWRCDTAAAHCVEIPFDEPRRVLLSSAMTSVSDGTISWIKTNQQEEYFATDTLISEDVTNTLHTQDVRVLDGHLHFVAVGDDNVAHLYRVDVVDNAFVYTETETWGPETMAIVPLAWPER